MNKFKPRRPYPGAAYRQVWRRALELAQEREDSDFVTGHLMLAVAETPEVQRTLALKGLTPEELRLYFEATLPSVGGKPSDVLTATGKNHIRWLAKNEASRMQEDLVGPGHLFLALLRLKGSPEMRQVTDSLGLNVRELRELVDRAAKNQLFKDGHPLNEAGGTVMPCIGAARQAAVETGCGRIDTTHLMMGVAKAASGGVRWAIFRGEADTLEAMAEKAKSVIQPDGELGAAELRFTPAARKMLENARKLAKAQGKRQWFVADLHHYLEAEFGTKESAATRQPRLSLKLPRGLTEVPPNPFPAGTTQDWALTGRAHSILLSALVISPQNKVRAEDFLTALSLLGTEETTAVLQLAMIPTPEIGIGDLMEKAKSGLPRLRFSRSGLGVLVRANRIARASGRALISPEHFLMAMFPGNGWYWTVRPPFYDATSKRFAGLDVDAVLDALGEEPYYQPRKKLPKGVPGNAPFTMTGFGWLLCSVGLIASGRPTGPLQQFGLNLLALEFGSLLLLVLMATVLWHDDLFDRAIAFGAGMLGGLAALSVLLFVSTLF